MPAKSHSNRKFHDPRMLVEHAVAENGESIASAP